MVEIATSILANINKETILKLNKTDTDYIHVDVMDGLFVKNKAFSRAEIKMVAKYSKKPLDIHLMVKDIDYYLKELANLKGAYITFHYEVFKEQDIDKVKKHGIKCGISLNPNTKIENVFPYLNKLDLVLIMSVEPGYGGQSFIKGSINKVIKLKEEIVKRKLTTIIAIDGGINQKTAKTCIKAGVDRLVVGNYIIKAKDYQRQIDLIRKA